MSDESTAPSGTQVDDVDHWEIDGGADPDLAGDGLSDTVVKIPPIRDDIPASQAETVVVDDRAEATVAVAEPPEATIAVDPSDTAFAAPAPAAMEPATTAPLGGAVVAGGAVAAAAAPPVAVRPSARPKVRRTRKARLRLSRLDPWSVMKTVFLFSIAFGIMFCVATWVTWTVVESSGLFEALNERVGDLLSSSNNVSQWRIQDYISGDKVFAVSILISVINIVIVTALGTIFAFLYNLSANVLGGLEVTLAED